MRALTFGGLVLGLACGAAAGLYAQSLGEVARQEEARRKAIKQPAKVYTNDNLRPSDQPAPPASGAQTPAATPAPPPAAAQPPAGQPAAPPPEAARDEKYWRGRIDAARTALGRAETFQDALQTRINALSADFVNRDDPAQRNVIAADRQKALAELDRVRQEIAAGQKAIADIQEEARRANVPAGWVR
jgi:gas vesicle protein